MGKRKPREASFNAYFLRKTTKVTESGDTEVELTLKLVNPAKSLRKTLVDFEDGYDLVAVGIVELPYQPLK